MVRFFRARDGIRYYAIDEQATDGKRQAVTSTQAISVGKLSRLELAEKMVKEDLFEVHFSEVPQSWRDAFRSYFWRERARK